MEHSKVSDELIDKLFKENLSYPESEWYGKFVERTNYMKCPFQTIVTTEQFNTKIGSVTTTTFADCIEKECPYYFERSLYPPSNTTSATIYRFPACKRVDGDR